MSHSGRAPEPLQDHPVYVKIRNIGQGAQGFVQLAKNKHTSELVAIKFRPRGWEPQQSKYVLREVLIHQQLSMAKHPHIVEFNEVILTPHYVGIVMEYVEGENLQQFLASTGGRVPEGLARFIFQQLVLALDFCHRKGKVNRDVKLVNTLLNISDSQYPLVKLCDFGFAKDISAHSNPITQVGTILFVAPEVVKSYGGKAYDGQAVDVWSCGVILYIMMFGRHPFLRQSDNDLPHRQQLLKLIERIATSDWTIPSQDAESISATCVDLLKHILVTAPESRFSLAQVQEHAWFQGGLPPGALGMNTMYLSDEGVEPLKQSVEEVERLILQAGDAALAVQEADLAAQLAKLRDSASHARQAHPAHPATLPTSTATQQINRSMLPPSTSSSDVAGSAGQRPQQTRKRPVSEQCPAAPAPSAPYGHTISTAVELAPAQLCRRAVMTELDAPNPATGTHPTPELLSSASAPPRPVRPGWHAQPQPGTSLQLPPSSAIAQHQGRACVPSQNRAGQRTDLSSRVDHLGPGPPLHGSQQRSQQLLPPLSNHLHSMGSDLGSSAGDTASVTGAAGQGGPSAKGPHSAQASGAAPSGVGAGGSALAVFPAARAAPHASTASSAPSPSSPYSAPSPSTPYMTPYESPLSHPPSPPLNTASPANSSTPANSITSGTGAADVTGQAQAHVHYSVNLSGYPVQALHSNSIYPSSSSTPHQLHQQQQLQQLQVRQQQQRGQQQQLNQQYALHSVVMPPTLPLSDHQPPAPLQHLFATPQPPLRQASYQAQQPPSRTGSAPPGPNGGWAPALPDQRSELPQQVQIGGLPGHMPLASLSGDSMESIFNNLSLDEDAEAWRVANGEVPAAPGVAQPLPGVPMNPIVAAALQRMMDDGGHVNLHSLLQNRQASGGGGGGGYASGAVQAASGGMQTPLQAMQQGPAGAAPTGGQGAWGAAAATPGVNASWVAVLFGGGNVGRGGEGGPIGGGLWAGPSSGDGVGLGDSELGYVARDVEGMELSAMSGMLDLPSRELMETSLWQRICKDLDRGDGAGGQAR